jgi:general secretion pathway protein K
MALLALIGSQITAAGHGESRLAINLRANAVAEAAADGAVFEAVFHLMDGSAARWPADGRVHQVKLPQAMVDVSMVDEGRKVTLNNSSLPLLRGLLHAVGLDPHGAALLADRIADWRSPADFPLRLGAKAPQYRAAGRDYGPPNQPYHSVDELALVLGMTPQILARLRPYVSPYIESTPKPEDTDPVVARALADATAEGAPPLAFDEPPTVAVTAVAVSAGGGRFVRRAVVRLGTDFAANPAAPQYTILDWDQGAE